MSGMRTSCGTIFARNAIHSMRNLLSLLMLAALLAGCGYKGPLYLPKPKPETQKPATPPAPRDEEENRKPDPS
jgi:predicted small lipoprotein YifL